MKRKTKNIQPYQLIDLANLFNTKKFYELKKASLSILESKPDNINALNALAISYKELGDSKKAQEVYIKLVNSGPKQDFIFSNAGNFFFGIGKIDQALHCHTHAIKLNPKNINSISQTGLILSNMGKNEEAINYYKKVIKIDANQKSVYIKIGNAYRAMEKYDKAAKYYELSNEKLAKCQQLECFYMLGDQEQFYKKLDAFSNSNPPHPLAATLSSHASIRFSRKDNYSFCRKPFELVEKSSLFDSDDLNDKLIDDFFKCFNELKISVKQQSLLTNGVQSSGNIFLINQLPITTVKNIILEKIELYKKKFANKNTGFISHWPKKYNLYGWLIIMNNGGQLGAHMHKEGWLSGAIYFERPKKLSKHDGDIAFSLHGSNYPADNKTFETRVVEIEKGDIVLFPSSLFHRTIPFESEKRRITLAFDIKPLG